MGACEVKGAELLLGDPAPPQTRPSPPLVSPLRRGELLLSPAVSFNGQLGLDWWEHREDLRSWGASANWDVDLQFGHVEQLLGAKTNPKPAAPLLQCSVGVGREPREEETVPAGTSPLSQQSIPLLLRHQLAINVLI